MVDARRRIAGDLHVAARHHGRERRAAGHPADLHSSFQDLQWVVDAYALTLAAFLLTSGSLGDQIGRRTIFIWGLWFTFSSAVCGLSSTPLMLNLARGVQGVGGAMMFATALH